MMVQKHHLGGSLKPAAPRRESAPGPTCSRLRKPEQRVTRLARAGVQVFPVARVATMAVIVVAIATPKSAGYRPSLSRPGNAAVAQWPGGWRIAIRWFHTHREIPQEQPTAIQAGENTVVSRLR